jgi:flagellar protein FliO/FliZ
MLVADYAPLLRQSLAYAALAIALVAGVLLVSLPFLRGFRRRVYMPEGGDAWHLSIVKRFAFGKRRQLIVIRRDGAEHIVMIGGPSDAVIETILDHSGRDESSES